MKKINVLVFPCGSEIGLEINRSLKHSKHFNLFGGSSVDDHGIYVYENYINGFPFFNESDFIDEIVRIVKEYKIDIIFPTMDSVIHKLSSSSHKIPCKIACSELKTTEICLSKSKTYNFFKNIIDVPIIYKSIQEVEEFPVFLKPDIGYSGRGTFLAKTKNEAINYLNINSNLLILEYLPGEEYTVDCFTDSRQRLVFCGARLRKRISNGISVCSVEADKTVQEKLLEIAKIINNNLSFRGAWFFQVKMDKNNNFKLLEVADRLGGSSSLFRMKGINFAELTLWDLLDIPIDICLNDYCVKIDRSLDLKFKINFEFDCIYVDLDDCLIIDNKVNETIIAFLYKCLNNNKKIILLTKHEKPLNVTLHKFRLVNIFDKIIQIPKTSNKSDYITEKKAIFIDDSFSERKKVKDEKGINVFSLDMIESLII